MTPPPADPPQSTEPAPQVDDSAEVDLPEQLRVRREKRQRLLDSGASAYPVVVPRTHTLAQVRAAHPDLEPGQETDDEVGVVGRVVFLRLAGKLSFVTLQEGDGTRLQAMFRWTGWGPSRWPP